MLDDDLQRFLAPAALEDAARASDHFDRCAGVELPALESLQREIFSDLDTTTFGVRWWSDFLPTRERILIADHLVQCPTAVVHNLVEANLHFVEAKAAWAEHSQRTARALDASGRFALPPYERAADMLCERHASMHVAGTFRAAGSALDCLAATIIGVLPLPLPIVRADFSQAFDWLRGLRSRAAERTDRQRAFCTLLEGWIADVGPHGWLTWIDEYRNMLVHRPRRVELYMVRPEVVLVDAKGRPIPRVDSIPVLAGEPGISDVEAIRGKRFSLSEDGRRTLRAMLESVHDLCRLVGEYLLNLWVGRRESPDAQPTAQWREQTSSPDGFAGYAPGTIPTSMDQLRTSQQWVKRLSAAALTSKDVHIWSSPESSE